MFYVKAKINAQRNGRPNSIHTREFARWIRKIMRYHCLYLTSVFFTRYPQSKLRHTFAIWQVFYSSFNAIKEKFLNSTYCNCNLTSFYHHLTLNECRTIMRYYPSLCYPQSCQLVCGAAMYCCCMYVVCNCCREEAAKRSPVHTRLHVHSYTNCCVVPTRIGFE